jgi:ATP-dependent Lhr-like helicase
VLRAGRPLVWFDRRGHHLVTFPDALVDVAWTAALIDLVKTGRVKAVEIRKIDGEGLADAPAGLIDLLRSAGFADGYRGLVVRG